MNVFSKFLKPKEKVWASSHWILEHQWTDSGPDTQADKRTEPDHKAQGQTMREWNGKREPKSQRANNGSKHNGRYTVLRLSLVKINTRKTWVKCSRFLAKMFTIHDLRQRNCIQIVHHHFLGIMGWIVGPCLSPVRMHAELAALCTREFPGTEWVPCW